MKRIGVAIAAGVVMVGVVAGRPLLARARVAAPCMWRWTAPDTLLYHGQALPDSLWGLRLSGVTSAARHEPPRSIANSLLGCRVRRRRHSSPRRVLRGHA